MKPGGWIIFFLFSVLLLAWIVLPFATATHGDFFRRLKMKPPDPIVNHDFALFVASALVVFAVLAAAVKTPNPRTYWTIIVFLVAVAAAGFLRLHYPDFLEPKK